VTSRMARQLRRVLIANRGEIALRVVRACRELGIESIVAFSEADRDSLPVQAADRAICIGAASAAKSYLNARAIVGAAVAFKADGIHPGYGFLSEKSDFAELCEREGVTFIGPSSQIIRSMGDKIAARAIAKAAGVPTTPGSEGAIADPAEAMLIADTVGFPLLIKAASGGGGRGMRVVEDAADLKKLIGEAMAEAQAAFGDASIYVEKYLKNIRHIEVQILGDGENLIHLGERDCSTQRRNQKLLEESPSPVIDATLRNEICDAALRLCKSVGYSNAGTVEFICDLDSMTYFFIEMNTRIQVEHPVTEMITGVDLVKQQLRIAAGEPLTIRQNEIRFEGHAIECRLNAEDHQQSFKPSPGVVTTFLPPGGPGVRVDSHLKSGYLIPPYYDSLVAKLICWGRDREEARVRTARALREFQIEGVHTTVPFHQRLVEHPDFCSGSINTRFVHDVLGF